MMIFIKQLLMSILLLGLSAQVFATNPDVTTFERISSTTIRINFDQPVKSSNEILPLLIRGENGVAYAHSGDGKGNVARNILNYDSSALVSHFDWIEPSLATMDAVTGLNKANVQIHTSFIVNNAEEDLVITDINNKYFDLYSIISIANFNANEGDRTTHTLVANNDTAQFSIIGDVGLFSLSGDKNKILTFNGSNVDFESGKTSHIVKIKASSGVATNQNAEQTLTVTIVNALVITPNSVTVLENTTKTWTLSSDESGVTWTIVPDSKGKFSLSNSTHENTDLTFSGGSAGKYTVQITAQNDTFTTTKDIVVIVTNATTSAGSSGSGGGGGGGCVYNPNAPARFDIVFILLLLLSGYYFRTRFSR